MKILREKYLKNMLNNQFLGSEKYCMESKDRELKNREEKIKRETEELFYKPITVSKDDMDKFQEQEMKKIKPIKRNWFDRLIKQNVMGKKPKIIRDKLKYKTINDIWSLFETEEEKEDRSIKDRIIRIIKNRIIRDISALFEQEEQDYYEPKRVSNF